MQGAQVQTRVTRGHHQAVGQLPAGRWYDFWVRAETRVGEGPATPITTIRVQDTGSTHSLTYTVLYIMHRTKTLITYHWYNIHDN